MYTLLIADDEPIIRNGVKNIIDWQSLGFSRILLAEDGQEALELIRNNKVDLVLTDIVMPFMDGVELTKIIAKEYPDIHVVILTGHEDFEYARQSVNLGVKDYILKPAGAETMYRKMKKICERLHIENTQKEYISSIKKQLNQSMPVMRSQILNRIVCMPNSNVDFCRERAKSFHMEFIGSPYEVGVVELAFPELSAEDYDLYMFAAQNIVRECLGERNYVFTDGSERLVILFQSAALGEDAHEIVYQTLNVIRKAIYNFLKVKVTCAAGSEVNSLSELYDSYVNAKKALDCKYSLGAYNVYDIKDLNYLEKAFYYPRSEIKRLMNCIKFENAGEVRTAVSEIVSAVSHKRNLSGTNMKMIYIEIVTSLLHELSNVKDVPDKMWSDGFQLFNSIERLGTPGDMEEKLFAFSEEIRGKIQAVQTNSSLQIIEDVKEYISRNFKDLDLSLSSVAEHANVSTGYLSGLFKKEAGTNFVKYLTDLRMEKSMELLRYTDMKTYEIAYETGFANPHYFSVAFKKYTGMSPSDFRQRSEN